MSRKRVFSVELPGSVVDEFNKFTESTGCLKYRLVQAGMWLMRVCPPDLRDALAVAAAMIAEKRSRAGGAA